MRAYLAIVLSAALLLQSCTSMYGVSKDEGLRAISEGSANLNLRMRNRVELEVKAGRYIFVNEPADFYFGTGRMMKHGNLTSHSFHGTMSPVKIEPDTAKGGRVWMICWRDDSSAVRFPADGYVRVTPELGPGLYICGMERPIPPADILAIEVEAGNPMKTTGAIFAGLAVVVGLFAIYVASTFSLHY
jgi:hypothetical protein